MLLLLYQNRQTQYIDHPDLKDYVKKEDIQKYIMDNGLCNSSEESNYDGNGNGNVKVRERKWKHKETFGNENGNGNGNVKVRVAGWVPDM